MLIRNHSEVLRVEKRWRGMGDWKFSGNGFTYREGWAGLISLVFAIPLIFLLRLILPRFMPDIYVISGSLLGNVLSIAAGATLVYFAAKKYGKPSENGATLLEDIATRVRYHRNPKKVISGEYIVSGTQRIKVAAVVRQIR
jgi:hypothetical protein